MNRERLGIFFKISGLFISSRLAILFFLFFATNNFTTQCEKEDHFYYSHNQVLNYCGYWDSGWYLYIANNGYTKNLVRKQSDYGFFPLYPAAMKLAGLPVHNNFNGGVIASNIFLLLASFFLYFLCLKIYNNKKAAFIAVVLLYFFPESFLFSGVFSEAAFICFSLMCVYFFEEENYLLSGVSGFLLALTRPFGVLIIIPLLLRYFFKNGFEFKPKLLFLLLIPIGILSFFTYCYFTTGDFFVYIHDKQKMWHAQTSNPIATLLLGLMHPKNNFILFNSLYTVFMLVLSVIFIKRVPFYLWLWALILIVAPLANGKVNLVCMPRYIVVCFPIMMALAAFTERNKLGWLLIIFLAVMNFVLACYYSLAYQFAA